MRVFCINDNGWYEERKILFFTRKFVTEGPDYGDICTVTRSFYEKGELYYDLLEWPPCSDVDGYNAECFIPLSEVDEMELVNKESVSNV